MATLKEALQSTIMSKVLVAVTGGAMVLFAIGHMAGHLLMFGGAETYNKYAQGLHDLGGILWAARIGLIVFFLVHIWQTIRLKSLNTSARPQNYVKQKPVASSVYSRSMIWSGLLILAFVVYHLLHFTFGKVHPEFQNKIWVLFDGRTVKDVYSMVVASFKNPLISTTYILAMILLFFHLAHAIASMFQTLGFNHPKYYPLVKAGCSALAFIICFGYIAIPIAILFDIIKPLV